MFFSDRQLVMILSNTNNTNEVIYSPVTPVEERKLQAF
jgi:hypothetical protein